MARTKRVIAAVAVSVIAASSLAACGEKKKDNSQPGGPSGGSPNTGATVILGTTDSKVTSLDPAGAYDLPSWTIYWNTFQTLLSLPAGSTTPTPDAAQKCEWTNPKVYTCTLKDGLTFSNGTPLTSEDVKFSFDRMMKIADPEGPSSLLESLEKTDAPDPKTVVFTLKTEDATLPHKLTTGVGMIVPSDEKYPADKLREDNVLVGSGPYKLDNFKPDEEAAFSVNASYKGDAKAANGKFVMRYYAEASTLKQAVQKGDVDVAFRGLTPTDVADLRGKASGGGYQVIDGEGTELRYMTFNVTTAPADQKAVRQAIAQVVDREAIAKNVYNDTVTPTYSMIPNGVQAHTDAFKDKYGAPDKAKAKAFLDAAGITQPVNITLWYTPTRYGAVTADEYVEIKRQLEASGLFKVDLQSTEWQQYQTDYKAGKFAAFGLGWFPDFPDPDNYTAPFLYKGGYFKNNYDNPAVNDLVTKSQGQTDRKAAEPTFADIQKQTAEDVPVLPMWQGKQIAAARTGVTGVKETLDPSYIVRFWMIGKQ
ncbi:ABC transporter substrate-binding protein [Streptodolium elevatio]|uniref:ABC transporter substrate-binding protein n=1 Tax=Streptodolium elevatio TaxID=3157996 RepID=A0ABV3DQV2_9ACTN